METLRAAAILFAKELRLEFRTRELLTATVVFALIIVIFFSFAFDPTPSESRRWTCSSSRRFSFRLLYGLLIARHSRRYILWLRVTALPASRARHHASGTKSYSPIPCSTKNTADVSPPLVTRSGRLGGTA